MRQTTTSVCQRNAEQYFAHEIFQQLWAINLAFQPQFPLPTYLTI